MKSLKPEVIISLKTNARHLQQVYTGFEALQHQKMISLVYQNDVDTHNAASMNIIVNGYKFFIDCADSSNINIDEYYNCDFYFKRTLRTEDFEKYNKLYPFGLYFEIYPSVSSFYTAKRFLKFSNNGTGSKVKTLIKCLDVRNHISFVPRVNAFDFHYSTPLNQKVLFYVRLWDPDKDKEHMLSPHEREDRKRINECRIECIELLKEAFKENALVGVMDDDYSRKLAPNLILPLDRTVKKRYFEQVKDASICIASTGLHSSIGAKFAEYVALRKAIVCESFDYQLPGNLQEGINYYTYETPQECVGQVKELLSSPETIRRMSAANNDYYNNYLAPVKIAKRLLEIAGVRF